ncbi:DUF1853 family protein [Alcanivorax jadensis]|uniref:DUF1853 family protein n=1 Tax=Alcanivorax jadensis TaxID=64988 RepID=UPI002358023D|nr:DUF1853 family protein [Alcanivorax jadensis]|tara:strand:+ start:79 stop:891 length:813 start_codon:yes stop_codon:yes gene_type:complete
MNRFLHTPAGLLRWLVEAPSLLPCPSPCRDAGELLKREYQLDPGLPERASLRMQAHTPARRLGLMFEQWVSALIDASNNLERIASNLPFRHQGRTLGELDLLVRDHLDGKLWHWELALKFYLGTEQAWFGPNSHDTLDRKARHLFDQQLPRSSMPEVRTQLAEQGWQPDGTALLSRGRLFYRQHTPTSGQQPHPGHERGWWLPSDALDDGEWSIVERPYWPCPFMSDKSTTLIATPTLIDYVETRQRPLMVTQRHRDTPGFIVPVSWPNT